MRACEIRMRSCGGRDSRVRDSHTVMCMATFARARFVCGYVEGETRACAFRTRLCEEYTKGDTRVHTRMLFIHS